jgi:exopolysaccharide production protein ExoQ
MSSTSWELESRDFVESSTNGLSFVVGFFFSFRLLIVLLSVRVFGTDPQVGVGASLAINFSLLIIVAFFSSGGANHPFSIVAPVASLRWALAFLGFSCCSLLWSSTASLPAAIAYWCAMAADVAIIVLLLRRDSVQPVAKSLMKGYVWGACVIAIIAWVLPQQSDLRLGDEELLGPNQIGYACAFALFFAQYLIRALEGKWRIPALLLAVTLLRSLSKTTIIACLLSESFLLLRDKSMSRSAKAAFVICTCIAVAVFWTLLSSYYDVYINAGSQAETLTGRFGIWAYIFLEAIQQPWIGHGFHSVWKVIPPFGPDQFEARHAHNELLQQFYAYGFVGISLMFGIYGSMYLQIRKLSSNPLKTFFLGFLIFILIRGFADTEPFDLSLPLWAIVMISTVIEQARTANEGLLECGEA